MANRPTQAHSQSDSTPGPMPQITPQAFTPMADHSFTLQAIMEMQKTLGILTQAVGTLTEEQKKSRTTLDDAVKDIHAAKFSMRIILGILGLVASGLGVFFWKLWDVVIPLIHLKLK